MPRDAFSDDGPLDAEPEDVLKINLHAEVEAGDVDAVEPMMDE